jgi:hypothetical protein
VRANQSPIDTNCFSLSLLPFSLSRAIIVAATFIPIWRKVFEYPMRTLRQDKPCETSSIATPICGGHERGKS